MADSNRDGNSAPPRLGAGVHRRITLEAIELVEAIDRHGSFAAAAERLYRVPSTVSYAIGKLEQDLGIALFIRKGPRVTLTPAGRQLIEDGRWLLRAAADLESRMRQVATGFESELRLIVDSLIPVDSLLDDIRAFEALDCGTQLRLGTGVMTGVWEALREGRADLIVASGDNPAGNGFRTVPVGSTDFVFCVAPGHPLVERVQQRQPDGAPRPLSRDDLLDHTAIVIADSARDVGARTAGLLNGQKRITVASLADKLCCMRAGLGHGFVPRSSVDDLLRRGALCELPTAEGRPGEHFWLAWRAGQGGEALKWWRTRLSRTLMPPGVTGFTAVTSGKNNVIGA